MFISDFYLDTTNGKLMYINIKYFFFFSLQRREKAEQVAYKLEQDIALCEYMYFNKLLC